MGKRVKVDEAQNSRSTVTTSDLQSAQEESEQWQRRV